MLYPLLAVGPLIVVFALARSRSAVHAGVLAALGLGTGIVLDISGLGIQTVPVDLALHRVALTGAIGLFGFGVARSERRILWGGLVVWLLTLAAPLVGIV